MDRGFPALPHCVWLLRQTVQVVVGMGVVAAVMGVRAGNMVVEVFDDG